MPEELLLDNPLAVIGDEDLVLGFRALGFRAYVVKETQTFKTILAEIIQNKTGICLVQEDVYIRYREDIDNYRNLSFPIFIPFSKTAQTGLLDSMVKAIRLKATGAF